MKIEIKSRLNDEIIFIVEADTIKAALQIAVSQDANLRDADLRGANLRDADLWGANLRGANLRDADLQNARLQNARLQYADLQNARLQNARLQYARLQYANLRGSDLGDANLWGADLRGANLRDAKNAPAVIHGLHWPVYVWADKMRIGCQMHAIDAWRKFSDDEIDEMDPYALEFWRRWEAPLLAIAELPPLSGRSTPSPR